MNNRPGIKIFFVFLFLSLIVLFQFLALKQSRRLDERFGQILSRFEQFAEQPAKPQAADTQALKSRFDQGDWLIWAMTVEPKTLNQIAVERDIYSKWITVGNIFEQLLVYDWDETTMVPLLAESFARSDDGLEITIKLRDDIHFSDGIPITADDVIFTYETIMMVDGADIAVLFEVIGQVEKLDKLTVKFTMKQPYFKALEITGFWDVGIYPKHIYQFDDPQEFDRMITDPVGSGPYVFESWRTGDRIVLRRNENYWGKKPNLEKVIYRFIPNDKARLQALRSGQVDMIIPDLEQ